MSHSILFISYPPYSVIYVPEPQMCEWAPAWPLSSRWEICNEIILHEQFPTLSTMLSQAWASKGFESLFPPLAWVTAERHVSSDERRRVSLQRIWLTLSDSSVPGQFRHTDIKHIKCLSQHFTWHCSSALICYPPARRLLLPLQIWDQNSSRRDAGEKQKK